MTSMREIPCCPELSTDPICDVLDMRRHLVFPTSVRTESGQTVNVDVVIHTRLTRCSGSLALGDPVYSTTLLPGEKVRLATSDRRSRFSFDSETKLAYRSEQISEEQYRMAALRSFLSDANSEDRSDEHASEDGHWDFHGDAGGSVNPFSLSASGDANARGSHNGSSSRDYLAEHRSHVEMSDHQSVEATRKAHSVSVGEVSTRTHAQGESEDHFESSSREFANANRCHAVTYLFYRINKTETITFALVSIERRIIDPAAPLPVPGRPGVAAGAVSVIPQALPATSAVRLETESRGYQSELQRSEFVAGNARIAGARRGLAIGAVLGADPLATPLDEATRAAALAQVDEQLVRVGLLDPETRAVSTAAQEEFGYSRTTALPTAGVLVKGCLDDCSTCEPELEQEIQLELERKSLENALLKRQIELLDKAQEYRCCPCTDDDEASPA